ncbi:MAG: DUF192 domain-containing protein [Candidatus Pacebacteria bacterium]|nr:DUF192 domain-containing protein [Candidatus Paceibacterota bacterium]
MSNKLKKIKLLIVVVFFFVCLILFYQSQLWQFFVKDGQLVKLQIKNNFFSRQGQTLLVEVAKSENSVRQGLSSRSQLQSINGQEIDGMLFIFPETKIRQFWMKDVQFDIDICWIEDKKLVNCTRRALAPEPTTPTDTLPIYPSPQKVDWVLETNPDFLSEEMLGDKLYLSLF